MNKGRLDSADAGAARPGLSPVRWGMLAFLCSEVAYFSTLLVSYAFFYGRDSQKGGMGGQTPREALSLPLVFVTTACLLASSLAIHFAERALRKARSTAFFVLWSITILLGAAFLAGTAYEWADLIRHQRLTISRNLFGTTFYTVVGFHALHVTAGVVAMLIVLGMALRGQLAGANRAGVEMVSWYWHFVDFVWVVVLTVVYLAPHLTQT